jgi:signal-transduction protein with cAMP-binding, CBS, and nucleotidyltransferase domain
MDRDCLKVPQEITIGGYLQEYTHNSRNSCVLLTDRGRVTAVVDLKKAGASSRQDREKTELKDFAVPIEKLGATSPQENLLSIAQQMNEKSIHQIPVYDGGDIIGLVTLENIIGFVNQHTEIKK